MPVVILMIFGSFIVWKSLSCRVEFDTALGQTRPGNLLTAGQLTCLCVLAVMFWEVGSSIG
jgi:hypothetical protein